MVERVHRQTNPCFREKGKQGDKKNNEYFQVFNAAHKRGFLTPKELVFKIFSKLAQISQISKFREHLGLFLAENAYKTLCIDKKFCSTAKNS
jgi:hypothetical protein